MTLKDTFSLRTVRKKLIMLSKIAGVLLILSYIVATRLPLAQDVSFLLWLGFVVVIVLLVDGLMGRFITKPIDHLRASARKMAQLDFSAPCDIHTNDEFGDLSRSLNTMAQNLEQALSQLKAANTQLAADVAKEQRLLAERKELVDNLSHEMKTPLGVIRAYAEGLQDAPDDDRRQQYTEVIIAETERMNQLITTLLDLSALENGASQLRCERFDFVELTETVAGRLLIDVPDADFVLDAVLPEHAVYVQADKVRMEQVLNNLIVNAKRHTAPGGLLTLSLTKDGGLLHVAVFNQGAPIPVDSLSKIWTKFYRDDDAKGGGSGLGLAIVAQILSMHDADYGVENVENGVVFYFSLPVAE